MLSLAQGEIADIWGITVSRVRVIEQGGAERLTEGEGRRVSTLSR